MLQRKELLKVCPVILTHPYSDTLLDKGSWLPSSTSFERRSGGGSIMQFGGAPKCPRCEKSVYAAEKIIGAGKVAIIC